MPGTTRYETVTASDGGTFDAFCAVPDREGPAGVAALPGDLRGQRQHARPGREAAGGRVRGARAGRVLAASNRASSARTSRACGDGIAVVQQLDWELGAADIDVDARAPAGHARVRRGGRRRRVLPRRHAGLPLRRHRRGSTGRGPGRRRLLLRVRHARHARPRRVDRVPDMFHYGDRDPFIPGEQIDEPSRRRWPAARTSPSTTTTPATPSPTGTRRRCTPPAADLAWDRTLDFFSRHLGA